MIKKLTWIACTILIFASRQAVAGGGTTVGIVTINGETGDNVYVPSSLRTFDIEWEAFPQNPGNVSAVIVRVNGCEVTPVRSMNAGSPFHDTVSIVGEPGNYHPESVSDEDDPELLGADGTITLTNDFEPGPQVIQIEMFFGSRRTNSASKTFWTGAYKDEPGALDCERCPGLVGKPIDVSTGEMHYETTDLVIQGPLPIRFSRRYQSQLAYDGPLGYGWQHAYEMRIEDASEKSCQGQRKAFVDPTGRRIYFGRTESEGNTHPPQEDWHRNFIEDGLKLLEDTCPSGASAAWCVVDKHAGEWRFDSGGKLTSIVDRNGNAVTMTYSGANLTAITDAFGRATTLTYSSGRLATVSADGRTITYSYTNGNLTGVEYPDRTSWSYEYDDKNDAHNLTAVIDANTHLVESHVYDSSDRVIHSESQDDNLELDLSYDSTTQTTVTDSLDRDTIYTHDLFSGLVTAIEGPGCDEENPLCTVGGGPTDIEELEYDDWLNLREFRKKIDVGTAQGGLITILTETIHDPGTGNLLSRTDADGSVEADTTNYVYDETSYNFPKRIARNTVSGSGCTTLMNVWNYFDEKYETPKGDLTRQVVQGCKGVSSPPGGQGFQYTTLFEYNDNGQVIEVDGPRTDVSDTTTYAYYSDSDTNVNRRGRLSSVTDAVGNVTTFDDYDLFGNVGSVVDPNGVETEYLYDWADRISEVRVKGATTGDDVVTEYHYDAVGNLDIVRLPNCVALGESTCPWSIDYSYDGVNRLVEIADPLGNKIKYTYDAEGNQTKEEYKTATNDVRRLTDVVYNAYDLPESACSTNISGTPCTIYEYYEDGKLQVQEDPEGHKTTREYTRLRLPKSLNLVGPAHVITTRFEYDDQRNLSLVKEPKSADSSGQFETKYFNNDLGWVYRVISPSTGTTNHDYDPAGNLVWTKDNANAETTRTYDALNRLLTVNYPGTGEDVGYSYCHRYA